MALKVTRTTTTSLLILFLSSLTVTCSYDGDSLIWNGCETPNSIAAYESSTVEEPSICATRLPKSLEGVPVQTGTAPYVLSVYPWKEEIRTYSVTVSIHPNTAMHSEGLSTSGGKTREIFTQVYISAQTLEGLDVGSFIASEDGTDSEYDVGYCCGESRNVSNFYELRSSKPDPRVNVTWAGVDYHGLVIFKVTVIEDPKTYWQLEPYKIDVV